MIILFRSIIKNYRNFFKYTILSVTYAMRSTSKFSCIMTMISNFTIFFIFQILIFKFFFINITIFPFSYDFCCFFVKNFIFFLLKSFLFYTCSLNNSQNFFIQSLFIMLLFPMLLNGHILYAQKNDWIWLLTFVVD